MHIVIITGLSGSGKSTALRALEDMGFFCVDNLPVVLLPRFLKIHTEESKELTNVAMVMDLRQQSFLDKYSKIFKGLKAKGYRIEILFLDAGDDALLHRFSETRRVHPLSARAPVMEGVLREREILSPLKKMADRIIDTTSLNVHQLKDSVQRLFLPEAAGEKRLALHVTSFGYRYGLPPDADMAFDVRFLPNPHYVEELKHLDGHSPRIRNFVMDNEKSREFMQKLYDLLSFLLPLYEKEGKVRLNLAFGCTGGKHRSVAVANQVGDYFLGQNYQVTVSHRDIGKS